MRLIAMISCPAAPRHDGSLRCVGEAGRTRRSDVIAPDIAAVKEREVRIKLFGIFVRLIEQIPTKTRTTNVNSLKGNEEPEMAQPLLNLELNQREHLFCRILEILEKMPEELQNVFVLTHYDSRSPAEISAAMKIPESKVKRLLDQANKRFYRALRQL